jgi:S1-C subfamily serine protease
VIHAVVGFAAALLLVGVVVLVRSDSEPLRGWRRSPAPVPGIPASNPKDVSDQVRERIIERGKRASALVEVSIPGHEISGSAFCIDKAGLFVTNAHVIEKLFQAMGRLQLVIDIGLNTQRTIPARVRRADDYLDLALLEVSADERFTTLELGDDLSLSETAPVLALGFPLGKAPRYGREEYPNCSVISGKVTTFHGPRLKLDGIQFDGQINQGQSGGPVLDASGCVIGVAVATIEGKAMNLAVPVSRLSDFLAAPGIAFDPPALSYQTRTRSVSWLIKMEPAKTGGPVPDNLSVHVTIGHSKEDRRTCEAKRAPDGIYRVEVTPVPSDPPTPVRAIAALVEARKGTEVLATVHRVIELAGAPAPRITAKQKAEQEFYILTRPRPTMFGPFGPRIPGFGGFGPQLPGYSGHGPMGPRIGAPRESYILVVPERRR